MKARVGGGGATGTETAASVEHSAFAGRAAAQPVAPSPLMSGRTSAVVTARARAPREPIPAGLLLPARVVSQPTVIVEARDAGLPRGLRAIMGSRRAEFPSRSPGFRHPRHRADSRAVHPAGAAWAAKASSPRSGGCKRAPRSGPHRAGFMPTANRPGWLAVVERRGRQAMGAHLQGRRVLLVAAC